MVANNILGEVRNRFPILNPLLIPIPALTVMECNKVIADCVAVNHVLVMERTAGEFCSRSAGGGHNEVLFCEEPMAQENPASLSLQPLPARPFLLLDLWTNGCPIFGCS